jgi:low affinity Fe/Cu permease
MSGRRREGSAKGRRKAPGARFRTASGNRGGAASGARFSGLFTKFATAAARVAGKPATFAAAAAIILIWAISGPIFGFSDTWQLIINTSTTIVTFLMVFLIQNSQNRESEAVQIKLDELIRAVEGAHNALLDLEEMTAEDLDNIRRQYSELAKEAREELRNGGSDTQSPALEDSRQAR